MDPFGGIRGKDKRELSGFAIDKEEAIAELNQSIKLFEKRDVKKKSGFLDSLKSKNKKDSNIAANWNYMKDTNEEYINIHLRWCKKNIKTVNGVPIRHAKVALMGLKAFLNSINTEKPDFNHPYIRDCYTFSKNIYTELPEIPNTEVSYFKPGVHQDPFAGVRGEDIYKKFNDLRKDKLRTLEELDYAFEYLDQLSIPKLKREKKYLKRKPKNLSFTFQTSEKYLNIHFYWVTTEISKIENIEVGRARLALASLKNFISSIDLEAPNLENEHVRKVYEVTKNLHKPGKSNSSKSEFKPESEGGYSYWSYKTHRWVKGKFDRKTKQFIPPAKDL